VYVLTFKIAQNWLRVNVTSKYSIYFAIKHSIHILVTQIAALVLSKICFAFFNPLKLTGYVKRNRFDIQQLCILYNCMYVFCIYLRTNSDLCHLQHKLVFITRRGMFTARYKLGLSTKQPSLRL
jgi:hypothetical protein